MTNSVLYCSTCMWSTEERWHKPPRWFCLLQGGSKRVRINSDEQATKCEWYVKLNVNPPIGGAK